MDRDARAEARQARRDIELQREQYMIDNHELMQMFDRLSRRVAELEKEQIGADKFFLWHDTLPEEFAEHKGFGRAALELAKLLGYKVTVKEDLESSAFDVHARIAQVEAANEDQVRRAQEALAASHLAQEETRVANEPLEAYLKKTKAQLRLIGVSPEPPFSSESPLS